MSTKLDQKEVREALASAGWRDADARTPDVLAMLDRISADGAIVMDEMVTLAGDTLRLGDWVSPVWDDYDTLIWREYGVVAAVLWAQRGAGFEALDRAAAWMLPSGVVKARVEHTHTRRVCTSREWQYVTSTTPGTDAEQIAAGLLVHPAIVRFMRDDLSTALAADREATARRAAAAEDIFITAGEE